VSGFGFQVAELRLPPSNPTARFAQDAKKIFFVESGVCQLKKSTGSHIHPK
jgi:hypothetical protein